MISKEDRRGISKSQSRSYWVILRLFLGGGSFRRGALFPPHIFRPQEPPGRLEPIDNQESENLPLLASADFVRPQSHIGGDAEAHEEVEDEDHSDASNGSIEPVPPHAASAEVGYRQGERAR